VREHIILIFFTPCRPVLRPHQTVIQDITRQETLLEDAAKEREDAE
jgi:hypothetical protein